MEEPIIPYNQVLQEINSNSLPKTLLLGNGFSIAYNPDNFSFDSLRKVAETNTATEECSLFRLFNIFETNDFEKLLELLEAYNKINNVLFQNTHSENIKDYQQRLKKIFIDTISKMNPLNAAYISPEQYKHAKRFLREYSSIYTLNYDLLLYWVILDLINEQTPPSSYTDGFLRDPSSAESLCRYQENSNYNTHYLHGALHLWSDSVNTYKIHKKDKNILEEIQNNIERGLLPLFVSEGTASSKLNKIYQQPYLRENYFSLENIEGNLVIFGTILKENDKHIQQAILKSKVSHVFIGIYDQLNDRDSVQPFLRDLKKRDKNICLFDSRTTFIWKSENVNAT